ncbi:hypothetical protein SPRG_13677 [Saprolegnia parasitica CBS 223.65]|uniref:Amino acid transporter n=1 Tax=Saprolegnia parasitica (strain CBS 223.65) TaxID=695850 RepID=A0A067BS76_SAPPC|nr:hypothetical protein SPRG_13677 [Saprolegnia parasitica CBS 223.65]KDO21364.1 hypothetical protein SPRG_13677 [Saprolegnia parasitica CBS 223.65]|eukprot:XP_012207920.1 hypothetical protein SPRG_13677 [Saprolegnia parasitica CBS 223.65]
MSSQSTPQRRPAFAGELRTDFRRHANATASPRSRGTGPSPSSSSVHSRHPSTADSHSSGHQTIAAPYRPLGLPDTDVAMLSDERESEPKPVEYHDDYYTHLWTTDGSRLKRLYFGMTGLLLAIVLGVVLAFVVDQAMHESPLSVDAVDAMAPADLVSQLRTVVTNLATRKMWYDWIKLPGDLLIRALSCLVVPLVFVNVTVGIADLVALHKATLVGWRMVLLFLTTSILSAILGVCLASIVPASVFRVESTALLGDANVRNGTAIPARLACNNDPSVNATNYLGVDSDGTMACLPRESFLKLVDVNNVYERASSSSHGAHKSTSQVVFDLADELVTDNLLGAFVQESALLSVVVLSIPIGVALASRRQATNPILDFFRQLNAIFLILVGWVINFVPIAIIFLVASSFILPDDPTFPAKLPSVPAAAWDSTTTIVLDATTLANLRSLLKIVIVRQNSFFENFGAAARAIGTLVAVFATGTAVHCYVFLPLLTFLSTRRNPIPYILQLKKPLNFGFGSSCSLAALPMLIQAMDGTRCVSQQLTRFVVPVATGIHMDGAAFYLAAGSVFLVQSQPTLVEWTLSKAVMITLTSIITSWSVSPVPHAGLLGLMAVWNAVVSDVPPANFVWIVAMDVLLDRFATYMNILSNAVVTRIIAEQIDETYVDEQDRLGHTNDDDSTPVLLHRP